MICDRCKDWQAQGLSDTCPACDIVHESRQLDAQDKPPREFVINGHTIIVDEHMLPIIAQYKWHIRRDKKAHYVYANVKIGKKNHGVSMHRLLTGMRDCEIDHINRNGLDNRLENLRYATAKQNQANRIRFNRHGFRGVTRDKKNGWRCQIMVGGRRYGQSGFATAEAAARAYDKLSKEHHGEFGIRNFED